MREIVEYTFTVVNPGPGHVQIRGVRAPQGSPATVKMTIAEAAALRAKPGWVVHVYDELDAFRGGGGEVAFVRRSLSSADIIGLSTPIQLLPPPGPGKIYSVVFTMYCLNFKTVAYSNDQTGVWYGGSVSADTGSNGVFNGAQSQTQQSLPYSALFQQAFPDLCVNNSLNLWSPNSSADPGGNSTGSVTVCYSTIDVN